MHLGLCYRFGSSQDIVGFCDSDFAGDSQDSKSTSGHVFTLGAASISWRSKKQGLVALSSTESEYIGYSEASREAIWLKRLYHEITGTDYTPQRILCNNKSALQLVEQPRFNERSKHIAIQYHHIRDSFRNGLITLEYLQSSEMTADILTKPLTRDLHQKHVKALGLHALPEWIFPFVLSIFYNHFTFLSYYRYIFCRQHSFSCHQQHDRFFNEASQILCFNFK